MKQVKGSKEQKNETLVHNHQVDEVTFNIVKKDKVFVIAIGNYQISRREFKCEQAAKDYINQKPYEILLNASCLFSNLNARTNETKEIAKESK